MILHEREHVTDTPPSESADAMATLRHAAVEAAKNAYCPYSGFHVGAAVLAGGRVFTGCNVENASYGLTVCAERVAVFNALAAGCRTIEALAVVCPDARVGAPQVERMPCGACRQVLVEFGSPQMPVLVEGVGIFQLAELLPLPFVLANDGRS